MHKLHIDNSFFYPKSTKMTIKLFSLLLTGILISHGGCNLENKDHQCVNSILGDISFEKKFGREPNSVDKEDLRISTHLEYVEDILRAKDVSHLTKERQESRSRLLDLLTSYRNAGVYPVNYDYPDQRIPCFIDKEGRICAVGYLIEKSVGREVAEYINQKYKYTELLAMHDPKVDHWISESGLTKEECAMIQPAYSFDPFYPIDNNFRITTAFLAGGNMAFATANSIKIAQGSKDPGLSILGMMLGAGTITYGLINMPTGDSRGNSYKEMHRDYALINIGTGTLNFALGLINAVDNRSPRKRSTSFNAYAFPVSESQTGVAVGFSRRF